MSMMRVNPISQQSDLCFIIKRRHLYSNPDWNTVASKKTKYTSLLSYNFQFAIPNSDR